MQTIQRKGNMSKAYITTMPMAVLLAMNIDELLNQAKVGVTNANKAKEITDNNKASIPALGKVIAALKKRFNMEQGTSTLISTMTFPEYFKLKTGGKVNNHAESCGKAFGAYVDNGLIKENDYDICPGDYLEKAAAILTAVQGDLTHDYVGKAADILKTRPKDAVKQLNTLLEALKGPKTVDEEKAKEWLDTIYKSGHIELVLATAGAEIRNTEKTETLERCFQHIKILEDGCGTPEQQENWLGGTLKRQAPEGQVTPQQWLASNFPGITSEETTQALTDLQSFITNEKRLPKDQAELVAFMTAAGAWAPAAA
jgi:hypothetical protein